MLSRGLAPRAGEVQVMGRALESWGPEYNERVGFSFAQPWHYAQLSVRENLEHFASLYQVRTHPVDALLAWTKLEHEASTRFGSLPVELKHRLSWARGLLHDPDLWIVDEPHAHRSADNLSILHDLIQRHRAHNATVLICTPDEAEARSRCCRYLRLSKGSTSITPGPTGAALEAHHERRPSRAARVQLAALTNASTSS